MAFLNWKTVIHMFTVILVNNWVTVADGFLVVKPQDTQVLVGQVATLNCSTSLADDVHWYYGKSYVYAGRKLYSPFKDRLQIEVYQTDGSTSFNLVFPSAKPEDAGTFICRDNQGSGETSSAEITVFAPDGNEACQSNMKPDGVVIPNDCNIDPDEVQLSCGATYYGKNPPQLEWKKVPGDTVTVPNSECKSINNRIVCNTSIIADRGMNRSSYVCQINGSSRLNITLCTIEVKNLIYALNGKTMAKSSVGNEVQCDPDTSQSCNYKWRYSDTVISNSRTMTPDITGFYQCEAECTIRGKRCIVFDYAYISDDNSISISTGSVVAICILILLLVIAISTGLYFFLLRKGNCRHQQLPNMSRSAKHVKSKSLENGIQPQEEATLMQPVVDEPELIRTIVPKAASDAEKVVFGLAILGDELFVLSHDWPKIEVFGDLQKLESLREFQLTGHQLEIPWDMQSSSKYNCLYILDIKRNEEQKTEIVMIDPQGDLQKKWETDCKAGRLSVTNESNVIVTSLYNRKIQHYSHDGQLIRFIELPAEIVNPWVTLKRGEDKYVISYGNRGDSQQVVCVMDKNGKIEDRFGGKKGQSNNQLNVPVHMAAFSDGHIFVADKDNSRVVLLSPELKFLRELFTQGEELRFPNRLCLDERNKRLFISDTKWISNMKPWNDGRVLIFNMSSVQATFNINAGKN